MDFLSYKLETVQFIHVSIYFFAPYFSPLFYFGFGFLTLFFCPHAPYFFLFSWAELLLSPSGQSISCNSVEQLRVTFSEKRTKINPQTHIQKFEILHFLDNISKFTMIQNFFLFRKVYQINLKGKIHYGIDRMFHF